MKITRTHYANRVANMYIDNAKAMRFARSIAAIWKHDQMIKVFAEQMRWHARKAVKYAKDEANIQERIKAA